MPAVNLSGLVREPTQLSILDLLKAVAARRSQMRELAADIIYQHILYRAGLESAERGNEALLSYTDLETINKHGEEIAGYCKNLMSLRSDLRSYSHRLGKALPFATEDLLRRGNAILFDNPTNAGTKYLLGYGEDDTSEYVVELLASGESPARISQDNERNKSTQQLLDDPELSLCLSFFSN